MDFDPRDYDARENERDRGRGDSPDFDRDDDLRQPDTRSRDRDEAERGRGRGPGDSRQSNEDRGRNHSDDVRWSEREREVPDRTIDPREPFTRDLALPRGLEREIVRDRDRQYTLRGSETRTLSTVGAFRVVPARDLRDHSGREADPRDGDLRHLREQGLINTVRIDGRRDVAVVLTDRGRDLLESHRDRGYDSRQEFYAGLKRGRELEHDAQVYRAYISVAERLAERDARIERVVLDYELKREYQQWLHERDRDGDGRPDREPREIADWAFEHDLPYFDGHVHFPDVRIEYEVDGRHDHEDVEVLTIHYRGAHAAAVGRSGFSSYRGSSARIGGRSGSGGGRSPDPHLAEEFLD
jgi:DNA-binding MarR family transcriptional regulator